MRRTSHETVGDVSQSGDNGEWSTLENYHFEDDGGTAEKTRDVLTANDNVYREIARDALENWNGLSEADANDVVSEASVDELETQVGARKSIEAATAGILLALAGRGIYVDGGEVHYIDDEPDYVHFSSVDSDGLLHAIYDGKKDDNAFQVLGEALEKVKDKNKFTLDVLDKIHHEWIRNNIKKLDDPVRTNKRYQFLPLSLIGFKEAKADLLFAEPILSAAGMEIDNEALETAYDEYYKDVPLEIRGIKQLLHGEEDWTHGHVSEQLPQLETWTTGQPVPAMATEIANCLPDVWDHDTDEDQYVVDVARQAIEKLSS